MGDLAYKYRLIVLFLISLIATVLVYKPILKIAKQKGVVDNPDARKLQKEPIPVMGGIAVFFGIAVGLCFYKTMISYTSLFPVFGAMIVMMYLGFIDDILSLSPKLRFAIEIIVSVVLLYGLKCCIVNFQGLFGIDCIPVSIGVILSVITFLGVVNSINMIDGIDGLSSSFCIMILGFLGIFCFLSRDYSYAVLSAVSIGSLIPFFFHNLFGKSSKMFIGDGGTMMMGTAISSMIFVILRKGNMIEEVFPFLDFNRISFVLAVLSIPIADTLRVMALRCHLHKSPFSPDKNHLHHYLLGSGFSCLAIIMIEISMNLLVIAFFFISWALGGSGIIQLLTVIAAASLLDFGLALILSKKNLFWH